MIKNGEITEEQAEACMEARNENRVERIEDSKHIFTHVEWQMTAYAVKIASDFEETSLSRDLHLVRSDTLRREYAVPSAFSAYAKYF